MPVAMPEDLLPELKPLLKGALERSPTMILSGLDLARAEADVYLTKSAQLPIVTGSAGYQRSETNNVTRRPTGDVATTTTSEGATYNLGLNQPIYHWGALQAQTNISKLQVMIRERQFEAAYLDLAKTIRSQYLALVYKKRQVALSLSAEETAKKNVETLNRRLAGGQITAGVVEGARVALTEASLAREQTESEYDNTLRMFKRLAGVAKETEIVIADELPKLIYEADSTKDYTQARMNWDFAQHPQVLSARHELEQGKLRYDIAKVRLRPKFSAFISAGLSPVNSGGSEQIEGRSTAAGVSAYWTFFDGFATKGAKRSALAEIRSAEQRLNTQQQLLDERLDWLRKEVDFAGRRLAMVQTRTEGAEGGIGAAEDKQKRGVGSQDEIDVAKRAYQAAYLGLTAARSDFLNKWVEYVSLLGLDPVIQNLPQRFIRHGR